MLTHAGTRIGKVKSVHIHPKNLTVEGGFLDSGMFKVDQYFDAVYIEKLNFGLWRIDPGFTDKRTGRTLQVDCLFFKKDSA